MQSVLDDWTTADIPERTRAALRLLQATTQRPSEIDDELIQSLRADGLDDEAIGGAASVGFHFNLINRVADAFDFPLLDAETRAKGARVLNTIGRLVRGSRHTGEWTTDQDTGRVRPLELQLGAERMLTTEGATSPDLRRSIAGFVREQWGEPNRGDPPPEELHGFLRKLARYAYRITDEDVEALREEGYDDDALYEITVVGSFSAALVGVEHLYGAMYGEVSADA